MHNRKIVEQNRQCAICQVAFTNYSDMVPDHIDPRGMGGAEEWEGRGETIIQKISRLRISGATGKRARLGSIRGGHVVSLSRAI